MSEKEKVVKYQDYFNKGDIWDNDKGEEFVYVKALLRIAREHAGLKGWMPEVVQAPTLENEWSATVVVRCDFQDGSFCGGAADCRYTTAGDGFQNYTTALAETRALGRALRRYLGVELCTYEEQYTPDNNVITDNQRNCIEKKFFNKKLYTIKDVCKIVGREVVLTDLSEKEASEVISKFNKEFNKALKKKQLAK